MDNNEEVSTLTKWSKNKPVSTSLLTSMVGVFALWLIANMRIPNSFDAIITYLVVFPILCFIPGLALAALLLSISTFRAEFYENKVIAVKTISFISILLNLAAIFFFFSTAPSFF